MSDKQRVIKATGNTVSNEDGTVSGFEVLDEDGEKGNLAFETISIPIIISSLETAYAAAIEKMPPDDPTKPKHMKSRKIVGFQIGLDALRDEPILVIRAEGGFVLSFGMSRDIVCTATRRTG